MRKSMKESNENAKSERARRMQTLISNISVFYSFTPDYLKVR